MGFYDCMQDVAVALGRRPTLDEMGAIYEKLMDEKGRLMKDGYPSSWLHAARTVAEQIEIQKAYEQRNIILNKLRYSENGVFIQSARRVVNATNALQAITVGINTPIEGGRRSVAAESQGLFLSSVGAMLADMRRAAGNTDRLEKLFFTASFELEIAKALRGEKAHPDATLIGGIIDRAREDLRRQENDAGGWRGRIDGYVTRQSHDSGKVRKAGFEKWKAFIMPMLDQVKTFGRQAELKAQLMAERAKIWQQFMTGRNDLRVELEELNRVNKWDDLATKRGRRLDAAETAIAAKLDEGRKEMAGALSRYMDLAQRAREGERPPAPLLGEPGRPAITNEQVREARVALTRARERLRDLHDQHTRRRGEAIETDLTRQMLADHIEAAALRAERIEKSTALMAELWDTTTRYNRRIKGAVADPDAFLLQIYNHIAADTWRSGKGQEFTGMMQFAGPANLAKRRGAHRELYFKDAEAEVSYMRKFGAGGVADGIIRDLEGASNATALYRRLGTNPEAMFKRHQDDLVQEAADTGNAKLALQATANRLEWQIKEITGVTRQVHNPTVASWASTVRLVQSMAKLGGAMISSFGDVATAAAELRYEGRGFLSSYGEMFAGMMKGRRSGEARIIAELLGVGMDTNIGQVIARLGGESGPPGALSKAAALFFRLNGLSWWTDTHKSSAGMAIAHYYAMVRGTAFAELEAPTQRILRQYGIGPTQWEILRTAGVETAEGKEFMTPEGIKAIPLDYFADPSAVRAESERALRIKRDRLVAAYQSMIVDRVDDAVPTPGARERAVMNMGTVRGDVLGESLRFIMQFKSFGIAMLYRAIGREIHGHGKTDALSATARVMFLAAQLTVFGYLSMLAKDYLAGKKPRDPLDPATMAAAMVQGGGMGIYGDFFFGQFNRFGRSAVETAAGPTFGAAGDVLELWSRVLDVQANKYGTDLAANGLRIAASNTPFASLWWTRPALNYMALYPVQEMINPGYLHRMEGRVKRENKQTFWLPPSQTAPRL